VRDDQVNGTAPAASEQSGPSASAKSPCTVSSAICGGARSGLVVVLPDHDRADLVPPDGRQRTLQRGISKARAVKRSTSDTRVGRGFSETAKSWYSPKDRAC